MSRSINFIFKGEEIDGRGAYHQRSGSATMKLYVLAVLASVALAQNDCNDFKSKCQTACIAHSNGVSTNQCWGSPRYRLCKCSDATVLTITGYTCDHPTCPGGGNAG